MDKWDRKTNTEKKRTRRNYLRGLCIGLLGGKCDDCGEEFPDEVYDFHHEDPSRKEYTVSKIFDRPKILFKEVMKCILLCANCHRVHHHGKCKDESTD